MNVSLLPNTRRMVLDCIVMLEKYYDKVAASNNNIDLLGEDRDAWLNLYRPALVLDGPRILDDRFFFPDGSHPNYGIGSDATMNKYDFCNFLYHCYKLVLDISPASIAISPILSNPTALMVLDCLTMADSYVEELLRNPFGPVRSFEGDKMLVWKNRFYPQLVQTGIIPDGAFFGSHNSSGIGIGSDGGFTGGELMHFLYECLRYLHKQLA